MKEVAISDVEASGEAILSIVAGMGAFEATARRFLKDAGIDEIHPGSWYPSTAWLAAFAAIAKKVGARTLFYVGLKIPETALLPPNIVDVPTALGAIDVGYHMNHRFGGRPMFDPTTGEMLEGIGHYALRAVDQRSGLVVVDTPYPCDFDLGIVHGFAARFVPDPLLIRVTHATEACRKEGGAACAYRVEWL